jgi:predicted DsbA family dithiol-disulfide isomerase
VLVEEVQPDRTFTEYHLDHRRRAREMTGLPFDLPPVGAPYPSSSLPALEAAKWVQRRHPEQFESFDLALFEAFFQRTEDISDPRVLARLAAEQGLDPAELTTSLDRQEYRVEVFREYEDGLRRGVSSIPTVIIGGRPISGAVPYEEYARALEQAGVGR